MIDGFCDAAFAEVRSEFERNFAERDEVGASVCVRVRERTVVDLWGGNADPGRTRPWTRDTVCVVWSSTKGATALCAHLLAARGDLDLDGPVTTWWPQFGAHGKNDLTLADVLAHRSGISAISAPLPDGSFCDWKRMIAAIEAQEPFFRPGTRHGYQAWTFGWIVGEIIRRATGSTVGEFLRKEVSGPLGVDFWIGTPDHVHPRIAALRMPAPVPGEHPGDFLAAAVDPTTVAGLVFGNSGGHLTPSQYSYDTPTALRAEVPAGGGVTNARGLAGLYSLTTTGQNLRSDQAFSRDAVRRMRTVLSAGFDDTLLLPTRFTAGFVPSVDNRRQRPGRTDSVILGPSAFGHPGFGGSIGFADPDNAMSFGYAMNNLGTGVLLNSRGQALVDATYRALGATSDASGCWI